MKQILRLGSGRALRLGSALAWMRIVFIVLAVFGVLDAGYLSYEHFSQRVPPCTTSIFADCGKVLNSTYSQIGLIPLAVFGLFYYLTLLYVGLIRYHYEVEERQFHHVRAVWEKAQDILRFPHNISAREALFFVQLFVTTLGVLFSVYFVYLQVWIIESFCLYCMVSAVNSLLLWLLSMVELRRIIE